MGWVDIQAHIENFGPFPARISDKSGRGGPVTPWFSRETAERIASEINRLHSHDMHDGILMKWDGDKLIVDERSFHYLDGYEPLVVEPDADGFYHIGDDRWDWEEYTRG